jgi:hypothetical protein
MNLRKVINPCMHGEHVARFNQKTSPPDVTLLLSNGRSLKPTPLNPDIIPFVGERGNRDSFLVGLIGYAILGV